MNTSTSHTQTGKQENVLATNRVLRNTYQLLSMTLLFSALTAGVSMALKLPHPGLMLTLAGYFGLLYLTTKYRNRDLGIAFVFALTGFMGYTLGPILTAYLTLANGAQIVMLAMGATAAIFLGLSTYVRASGKDFSFMGGFLLAGIVVAFLAGLGAIFLQMPALSLAVSATFVMLMAGLILYQTSNILNGGETTWQPSRYTSQSSIYLPAYCIYWDS